MTSQPKANGSRRGARWRIDAISSFEDEPGRLTELIANFVHEPAARTPATPTANHGRAARLERRAAWR